MPAILEPVLKRDRWVVAAALALVAAIAWSYLLRGAGIDVHAAVDHVAMEMPPEAWTWDYAVVMFIMWWVMMIAMMLPSAAAVLLLVAALNRRSQPGRMPRRVGVTLTVPLSERGAVWCLRARNLCPSRRQVTATGGAA